MDLLETGAVAGENLRHQSLVAANLLKGMANSHRLMILCSLLDGELSVTELNARVELSQSALSQHLSVLRAKNLVDTRRQAQTIYYSLADSMALPIIELLHQGICQDLGQDLGQGLRKADSS